MRRLQIWPMSHIRYRDKRSGQSLIMQRGETASTPSVCSGQSKLEAFCGNQSAVETPSPSRVSFCESKGGIAALGNLNHVQKAWPVKLYSVAGKWREN